MPHSAPSTRFRAVLPAFRGRNVLVTGASSGVGRAIAGRFAQHGANVVFVDGGPTLYPNFRDTWSGQ